MAASVRGGVSGTRARRHEREALRNATPGAYAAGLAHAYACRVQACLSEASDFIEREDYINAAAYARLAARLCIEQWVAQARFTQRQRDRILAMLAKAEALWTSIQGPCPGEGEKASWEQQS